MTPVSSAYGHKYKALCGGKVLCGTVEEFPVKLIWNLGTSMGQLVLEPGKCKGWALWWRLLACLKSTQRKGCCLFFLLKTDVESLVSHVRRGLFSIHCQEASNMAEMTLIYTFFEKQRWWQGTRRVVYVIDAIIIVIQLTAFFAS